MAAPADPALVAQLEELLAASRRNVTELRELLKIVSSHIDATSQPARVR